MRWLLIAVVLVGPVAVSADEIRPTFAMLSDPEIVVPERVWILDPEILPLWKLALARPETEYQRRAAEAIARAQRQGFPGMNAFQPELLRLLTAKESDSTVVFAAADALIALNARDAAEALFQATLKGGADLRYLIEPALAAWDYPPIREVWRKRLNDPSSGRRDLLLAAAGASQVRDVQALRQLVAIARDSERPVDVRLAMARAAGAIAETGLEADAAALTSGPAASIADRLFAVSLLNRHTSEAARLQLAQFGRDPEPTVAAAALGVLLSINPELVLPLVEESLKNADANVRLRAAECYIALPTVERIAVLVRVLDDPHPGVRGRVRDALFAHARQAELNDAVRGLAMDVLHRESWRGQEQAALLLGALDHEPAAVRLVELLESTRPEVMIASACGLRVLAVPETLPALLDKAERQTEARATTPDYVSLDHQVAHLFEALGQMNHASAIPLMKRWVPKDLTYEYARSAAIWSLGLLLEGQPDEPLAKQLIVRAQDVDGMPPELELVQRMCAITIARMGAQSQVAALRQLLGPTVDPYHVDMAHAWAIHRLTGEELPVPKPVVATKGGWFLEPLRAK